MLETIEHKLQNLGGQDKEVPEILSYKQIRKIIGILGMCLAFILWIGNFYLAGVRDLQPSISHFYYTNMRDIFVGTMFAVAIFLFCYRGHNWLDSVITNIAASAAILVSLFPTDIAFDKSSKVFNGQANVVSVYTFKRDGLIQSENGQLNENIVTIHNGIHNTCAIVFFLSLSYMAGIQFTKSNKSASARDKRKKTRNRAYRVCALVMLGAMIFIFINRDAEGERSIIFWGEAIALFAFGISWFIKGMSDKRRTNPLKKPVGTMMSTSNIVKMEIDDTLTLTVKANEEFSADCIEVLSKQQYQISWNKDERWCDLGISSGLNGYYNPFALAKGMRVDAECMALCGTYDWDDQTGFEIGEVLGTKRVITVLKADTIHSHLSFFANDVPGYYWNNSGEAIVEIKRIA